MDCNESSECGDVCYIEHCYIENHNVLNMMEIDRVQHLSSISFIIDTSQVNHQHVSAFLTAGNINFMLLHTGKSEDSIRNFFADIYELYVKVI